MKKFFIICGGCGSAIFGWALRMSLKRFVPDLSVPIIKIGLSVFLSAIHA